MAVQIHGEVRILSHQLSHKLMVAFWLLPVAVPSRFGAAQAPRERTPRAARQPRCVLVCEFNADTGAGRLW